MLQAELTQLFNWSLLPEAEAESLMEAPEVVEASEWARQLAPDEQNEVLALLATRLPAADAAKASALLVLGGCLVEWGARPDVLVPAGLDHLWRLRTLYQERQRVPEAAWRLAIIGLMAMLARAAGARALLRAQPELMSWLDSHTELSDHFEFLVWISKVSDEDVLWVLFPEYETGLEVSVSQVYNTFHLLTLLQHTVRSFGRELKIRFYPPPPAPKLLRYAQGDQTVRPPRFDEAQFDWLNARAYEGGPLNGAEQAWGERPVWAQPRVRGRVVVIAREATQRLHRSWASSFLTGYHDALRPSVQVRRVLPPTEVRSLLDELHPRVDPAPPVTARNFWQRLWGK